MRHPSSRALFAIWDTNRGAERAPDRSDLPPEAMRALLGDVFVASLDARGDAVLRVAGTRVCALLGRDPAGSTLPELFEASSRHDLAEIAVEVAEECLVAVAGVAARGANGRSTSLELSLLPFRARAHTPSSLLGLLAPMEFAELPMTQLQLTSWRYLGHRAEGGSRRVLRKVALTPGLVVYEGLR